MHRRSFFGSLFSFGAVQTVQVPTSATISGPFVTVSERMGNPVTLQDGKGNAFLGKTKPVNGQCPVCGEMAEPLYRHAMGGTVVRSLEGKAVEVKDVYEEPFRAGVTCEQCRNLFTQEAVLPEKGKAK